MFIEQCWAMNDFLFKGFGGYGITNSLFIKRFKKEFSWLLAIALVVSSVALVSGN
jgi:hypothetical protein